MLQLADDYPLRCLPRLPCRELCMDDYILCGALWRLPRKESEFTFVDEYSEYLLRHLGKRLYRESMFIFVRASMHR